MRRVLFFVCVTLFVCVGCEKDDHIPAKPGAEVTGSLVGIKGCKTFERSEKGENAKSCIHWTYSAVTGILSLMHENAAFNCCPKEVNIDVQVEGNKVTVVENEIGPECRCNCLYDLFIEIENLSVGSYVIQIVEPYRHEEDEQILVPIDVRVEDKGSFCVTRHHYPWGS